MTEDRFYICDPGRETHLVVMMLNSGEFENALEEIRFEKEMGSDAAEDHVFAALARYELGMHEDLVREGAKSLNQFEEQIRKENSPAQAVAAKADIISFIMNSYLDRYDVASAGSFLTEVLPIISQKAVKERSRSRAAAAIARFYIQSGQEEKGETLVHNFLASCADEKPFRSIMSENYVRVADSFLTPVPDHPGDYCFNSQEDCDERIYWYKRAYEFCNDEDKNHYMKLYKDARALRTKEPEPDRTRSLNVLLIFVGIYSAIIFLLSLRFLGTIRALEGLAFSAVVLLVAVRQARAKKSNQKSVKKETDGGPVVVKKYFEQQREERRRRMEEQKREEEKRRLREKRQAEQQERLYMERKKQMNRVPGYMPYYREKQETQENIKTNPYNREEQQNWAHRDREQQEWAEQQRRFDEQQNREEEERREMERQYREEEERRYAEETERQYQAMMAEEERRQEAEAYARAAADQQDQQRAEYENSFYQNNSYDSYNSYDNYNSYDSYNNYDSYNSYDSYNNYDSYNSYDSSNNYDSY